LDRDFAVNLMLRNRLSGRQHEADEFELVGFDERCRPRHVKACRKRPYIDDVQWSSVWDRHVLSPISVAGLPIGKLFMYADKDYE
jgi:hypothetical protein